MCLYYPARKGPLRLTVAEWQSQRWVANKRAKCSITGEGKVVVDQRRAAKRKLIIPNPKNILHKQYTLTLADSVQHFCLYAPSLSFPFTYLWGLQVPWRRCGALQFMSNLVNILSPVRPVTHYFSLLSPLPHLCLLQTEIKCGEEQNAIFPMIRTLWFVGDNLTPELYTTEDKSRLAVWTMSGPFFCH